MKETQAQIEKYQALLPHMREKLAMVAMLFIMSMVMLTSATFAWVVLSANPEVKGINTTVAANGNLEIALSDTDGAEPDESLVGDSVKEIVLRNLTWGNLVNLSDISYGLGEIILRPAALNTSSLTTSPLFAAEYSGDGRVQGLTSEFRYANYDKTTKEFMVPNDTQYGVRSVSSVTYTFAGGQEAFVERLQAAKNALAMAQNQYLLITSDDDNMTAISKMMGDYLTEKFGDGTMDYQKYIPQVYSMMVDLDECITTSGYAYVYLANLQLMLTQGSSATYYTLETLLKATDAELTTNKVSIEGLSAFVNNYKTFKTHYASIEALYNDVKENGTAVPWNKLESVVNFIVHVNSTEVNGLAVKDIGMSEAASLLFDKPHSAVIYKGLLFDLEKMLGVKMFAEDLPISVSYKGMPVDLEADIYTDAQAPFYLPTAIDDVTSKNSGNLVGTDPVAAETYGMAIDLWVRTNAVGEHLILEGNVKTTEVHKEDTQGNLYYTNTETDAVVIKTPAGKYLDEEGNELTGITEDKLEATMVSVVNGYEGVNRVWYTTLDNENSTTQGSGSCYMFYSDTPSAQTQSLEALAAMTVVFIDGDGKLLAYADMDVESHYAEGGRVIVPLKLRSNSMTVENDEGDTVYAITELEQGVAKRITALIYVDGTKLENTDVLADADIQGQLNIQFGTVGDLNAYVDNDVYYEELHISGSATPRTFDFETVSSVEDLKSRVSLTVAGAEPETVKANFIRQINATQGTRQDEITFTSNGDGTYSADVQFTAPGEYVMRSVRVDGVEYDLDDPIVVSISGFAVGSVGWQYKDSYVTILSAERSQAENISITFAGALQPNKVQGIFANENNQQITVNFKKGTANWSGSAKFSTSGVYTLEYLIVDGEYYEIPASMQKTIDLSLGMAAQVTIPNHSFEFDGTAVTLPVYVTVSDDKGDELNALTNVSIQYLSQSSSMVENGLYSALTWNASTQRYEGNFTINSAGAYQFAYLNIGSGSINTATAPVITAIPPTPPAYYDNLTEESIFAYGGNVYMRIALTDSNAIANGNIIATIERLDESGNVTLELEIPGTSAAHIGDVEVGTNVTDWVFEIPTTDELIAMGHLTASQLGTWRMTSLDIIGAYLDGAITTEENPMVIDVSAENITTLIDDDMSVVVSGEGQEVDAPLFLESGTVDEGLVVQIRGAGGQLVAYEEDANGKANMEVSVTYAWDSSSITKSNGATTSVGYNVDDGVIASMESLGVITVDLRVDGSDPTKFILDEEDPMVLPFEGTYELQSVAFKINGTSYTASVAGGDNTIPFSTDSEDPSYELEWQAPIVTVTGVSPTKGFTANNGSWDSPSALSVTNEYDTYSATVYLPATFSTTTDSCTNETKTSFDGYGDSSSVKTKISNVNIFSEASMMVDGSEMDITYSYTSAVPENSQTTGYGTWAVIGWSRTLLGNKAKGTHVTISGTVANTSITYVFKLNNAITINNPY